MDFFEQLEIKEVIEQLRQVNSGLVDALLKDTCYTKRGRLNKSQVLRATGLKDKQFQTQLAELKAVLEKITGLNA